MLIHADKHLDNRPAGLSAAFAGVKACWDNPDTEKVLEGCFRRLGSIFPRGSNNTFNAVLGIDFDDTTCGLLYEYQECVVQELKTCSRGVGNTAQSLIRSVRMSTPCKHKSNSASGSGLTMIPSQ